MRRSVSANVPAPTKGLITALNQSEMPPDSALVLDNWFPDLDSVRVRNGFIPWASGMSGPIETLIQYSTATYDRLLACAGGSIYDASAGTAVGAALGSGYSNNRWQWEMMGTAGGLFSVMVNGQDKAMSYNGSALSALSFSGGSGGANGNGYTNVFSYKSRLYFIVKNSLSFDYAAAGALAGAVSTFDLTPLCKLGGYLVAGGTWSRDAGSGMADLCVFVTSNGEVLIYQGDNPSNASNWSLVTILRTGYPLGLRCLTKVGPDLCVLTSGGFIPLSGFLNFGQSEETQTSFTANIDPTIRQMASMYRQNFGFQVQFYPQGKMCLLNVPLIQNNQQVQYVVNTDSGAWCRFTGMNACCWGLMNGNLFFGGTNGIVYKADTGGDDNGNFILADMKWAINYFDDHESTKSFKLARPSLLTSGGITLSVDVNTDFSDYLLPVGQMSAGSAGTAWDTGAWDQTPWGDDVTYSQDWYSLSGYGQCGALRVRAQVKDKSCKLFEADVMFEPGGIL